MQHMDCKSGLTWKVQYSKYDQAMAMDVVITMAYQQLLLEIKYVLTSSELGWHMHVYTRKNDILEPFYAPIKHDTSTCDKDINNCVLVVGEGFTLSIFYCSVIRWSLVSTSETMTNS